MKTLQFSTIINAERETVWNAMIASDTYKLWTSVFTEGSYFEGSWGEGERIRFLSPDGSGITSVIAENRLHEFISIKHLGSIKNGIDDVESEEVRRWAPAFENYYFSTVGGATEVKVSMDVEPEFEHFMVNVWPKAFEMLKTICESQARPK